MLFFLFLALIAVIAVRAMTPAERQRIVSRIVPTAKNLVAAIRRRNPQWDAFRDRLRARSRFAVVTPALIAANIVVFVLARRSGASLLDWGASFGPRTTNGEWWRLATSLFVHGTLLHLVIDVAALATVGPILERYVGTAAFAAIYVTAGALGAGINLHFHPIAVSGGASGALFALYGLLIVCWLMTIKSRTDEQALVLPVAGLVRLAPAGVIFLLYSLGNDGLALAAECAAGAAGIAAGVALAARVATEPPAIGRAGLVGAVATLLVAAVSAPLHGMAYVQPEIERVIALETKTTADYDAMYDRFKHGRVNAQALAQSIERRILPELQQADERLKALTRVPAEQQTLVADAQQYLELRAESWRLRAQALRSAGTVPVRGDQKGRDIGDTEWRLRADAQHRANGATFGRAEGAERASLDALQRVRSAADQRPATNE